MKILLIGKNGQVGFELRRSLSILGDLVAVGSRDCDLSDINAIKQLIRSQKPDVIVNAAAFTAVDRAESNELLAIALNTTAPSILADEAHKTGALLVHYSTDYVFDGKKKGPYTEVDQPNPQSIYGLSKLSGDLAIQEKCRRHLILRTSWVMGMHGNNFAKTMLRLASERTEIKVVVDQSGVPTSSSLLSDITAYLICNESNSDGKFQYGLYNTVASGLTTWHEYACYVIERARRANIKISVEPMAIRAILTSEYPTPATRPTNSHLDTSKLRDTFGLRLPSWQAGLDYVLDHIFEDYNGK